jgi:hypothetical protein
MFQGQTPSLGCKIATWLDALQTDNAHKTGLPHQQSGKVNQNSFNQPSFNFQRKRYLIES